MADYVVVTRIGLRADPDPNTPEVAFLEIGEKVAVSFSAGDWSKVTRSGGVAPVSTGWLPRNTLVEDSVLEFTLYDEPGGKPRVVKGNLASEFQQISAWKKVSLVLPDGTADAGWIDTSKASGAAAAEIASVAVASAETDNEPALVLGVNERYRAALLKASKLTGIDPAALAALIDAEAAKTADGVWNPKSAAGTSTASGLTQFLDRTWLGEALRSNTNLNKSAKAKGLIGADNKLVAGKEKALLDLRFDPELSIIAAAEYGHANLAGLTRDGLIQDEIGDDEKARFMYLTHHEGLGGAKGFIRETTQYSFSQLATQVGASLAKSLTDKANGDPNKAYRDWLNAYIDRKIQPGKFRNMASPSILLTPLQPLTNFTGPKIPVDELSMRKDLAKKIQWRLYDLGYLDPPADGMFGPASTWALGQFCERNGLELDSEFNSEIAKRLVSPNKELPKIVATGTWFDKVISYMTAKSYFISRHPDCRNIVYIEGANADGTINDDKPNMFNDLRMVFRVDSDGQPEFDGWVWDATTEPGRNWTVKPMNPKGAARIAFDQYKAWRVGTHLAGRPGGHEALVQVAPVTVFRDLNKDFKRTGDKKDTGLFGINQHWGYDMNKSDLGRSSAGCLVGRTTKGHKEFMKAVKEDARYQANRGYKFMTAILPGDDVLK